jgi:hypothetical protein
MHTQCVTFEVGTEFLNIVKIIIFFFVADYKIITYPESAAFGHLVPGSLGFPSSASKC